MKTCAYCGRTIDYSGYATALRFERPMFWCNYEHYSAWEDELDQARWAEESSSIKSGEVRDPADDETPAE